MTEQDYIKDLEKIAKVIAEPFKNLPFSSVIRLLSGFKVISFEKNKKEHLDLLQKLTSAAQIAGKKANEQGIFTDRPNEAGNRIEPFVKDALQKVGLKADTPIAKSGKKKATGYPDIEINFEKSQTAYLECKTYNINNINTTQRAFYFSPSSNFKVTKDALHVMLSYQIEKGKRNNKNAYIPVNWKLYSLEFLTVDLKNEFNQSNVKMYGEKSDPKALLKEGDL